MVQAYLAIVLIFIVWLILMTYDTNAKGVSMTCLLIGLAAGIVLGVSLCSP